MYSCKKKSNGCPEIFITDSLGAQKFFLVNSKVLTAILCQFPTANVFLPTTSRESDYKSCWLFALKDAACISQRQSEKKEIFLERKGLSFLLLCYHHLCDIFGILYEIVSSAFFSLETVKFGINNLCTILTSLPSFVYGALFYRKHVFGVDLVPEMMISTQSTKTLNAYQKKYTSNSKVDLTSFCSKKQKYVKALCKKEVNHYCTFHVASLFSWVILAKKA